MVINKGRKKLLLLILAAIGLLFAFIACKNPINNLISTVYNSIFYSETPSTELTAMYFTGYEGENIIDDCLWDEDNEEYMCTATIFAPDESSDEELELNFEYDYAGATATISAFSDYPAVCVAETCSIEVVVSATGADPTVYTILYTADLTLDDLPATFYGTSQGVYKYVVPRSGTYLIEAWGAAGGDGYICTNANCSGTPYKGGYGAYTAGKIKLQGGQVLYFYPGSTGSSAQSGVDKTFWSGGNTYGLAGGGQGVRSSGSYSSGAGGGSTDIRTIKDDPNTDTDDIASLASRIMVAAGGGGGSYNETAANWSTHGGGLNVGGLTDISTYCEGNQSSGYVFGQGMPGSQTAIGIGGGGGGWYGGNGFVRSAAANAGGPGCGGSSYISGHLGSIGVSATGVSKSNLEISNDISDSYSNTGLVFTNTKMIDGYNREWTTEPSATAVPMPSSSNVDLSNMYGNTGDGGVRITQTAKYAKLENVLSSLTVSSGTLNKAFKSDVFEYTLTLDTFTPNVVITGTLKNATTAEMEPEGPTTYTLDVGTNKTAYIFVTDIASGTVNSYVITIVRPELAAGQHSTLIEKLDNPNNPTIYFDKDVTTYTLPVRYGKMSVVPTVHLYDSDATYTIEGNTFLLNNTGVITITVTDPLATPNETVYTLNYVRETTVGEVEDEYIYYYTGDYQTFIAPLSGDYKIELWGGQGGTMQSGWTGVGGKGGYVSGELTLTKDDTLYIYVGGKGVGYNSSYSTKAGGWNGGGSNFAGASGGGGATDVRLISGSWNNNKSLASRIMVAGGGGGSNDAQNGGYGGGLVGGTGVNGSSTNGAGGTQLAGGGGDAYGSAGAGGGSLINSSQDGGAGGGGYFGGGKALGYNVAGGGGSSYISGHLGCIAVKGQGNSNPRNDSERQPCTAVTAAADVTCSYHYSGLIFRNTVMNAGNEAQPTLKGDSVQTGNADTGYAKITPLSNKSENNFLSDITFDYGTRDPVLFNPIVYDYTITTGIYTQFIELEGIPYDSTATVEGDGKKRLEIGENKYTITVTAENGDVRNYNVTVIREGLKGAHSNMINNILVDGAGYIYPVSGVYEYTFKLPYNKYGIELEIKLYDEDAKYEVTGADLVVANSGSVNIRVYHEDGSVPEVNYILKYNRQLPLYDVEGTYTYYCVKYEQEFMAPLDGEYYIETWGAAGGGATSDYYSPSHGGRGGYSRGTITLEQGESIYVRVGCQGVYSYGLNQGGGWNGGGHGGPGGYGGGGATDIRYGGNTLAKRILVAGGGGGADDGGGSYLGGNDGSGGVGGGENGENAKINGSFQPNTGGTQTSGYKLGNGGSATNSTDTGGAGGGYYGGIVTNNYNGGAGGGSGYVDKELFPDGKTIAGNTSFLGVDGTTYEFGHAGDGNAKISVLSYLSENYYLESITTDPGTWETPYTPGTKEYKIIADTYDPYVTIDATAFDSHATIKGLGKFELDMGDNFFDITVTAQNGAVRVYTLNVFRSYLSSGHSAELQKIKIETLGDIICEPGVYEYELTIPDIWYYLDVKPIPYDAESKQTLKGFSYIPSTQTATIVSRVTGLKPITYKIKIVKGDADTVFQYDYDCVYDVQTFTAPIKGYYDFQLWGAQGGTRNGRGGRGGYAEGRLLMQKDQTVYVYVGCSGNSGGTNGGWNGGGARSGYAGGGGATDIRTEEGDLYTRFIVAGGGGSVGASSRPGGDGGGSTGQSRGESYGNGGGGATQTAGGWGGGSTSGTFGTGGYGKSGWGGYAGAGGGGWYGGGGAHPDGSVDDDRGGGGGSGFVLTSATIANVPTGYKVGEEYYLKETKLLGGWEQVPNPASNGTMEGKTGHGFVRIKLAALNDNNFLSKIVVKNNDTILEYTPAFNVEKYNYTVNLQPNQTSVTIAARPDDSTATIAGLGTFDIPVGTSTKEIVVTSESGKDRSYFITFKRSAGTESTPTNIKISGLIEKYCDKDDLYCKLSPNDFKVSTTDYTMTVPYQISQLDFTVVKPNENQFVTGSGKITLKDVTTNVSIAVQSEACALSGDVSTPGCVSTYSYSITRDFSGDADLKSLAITDPSKELLFDREITEYTLSVPYAYTSIGLTYEVESEYAEAEVLGNKDFVLGWNRVVIQVTAADGTVKLYGLNIYREKNTSTFLSNIVLTSGEGDDLITYPINPAYNRLDFGFYEFVVPNDITNVKLTAPAEETELSTVEFTISGGSATIDENGNISNLPSGITFVYIKVTAQDGSSDTYKVRIVRQKNSNSLLQGLIVKMGDVEVGLGKDFSPTDFSYTFTVPVGTDSLDITAIPQAETSTVAISGTTLRAGENIILITVTAEDGTQSTYTLTINRPPSSNNILSSLKVQKIVDEEYIDLGYTPAFDTSVFEYSLFVPNEIRQVRILGTIDDELATIVNNGKVYSLAVGENKITVEVVSESGETREYTITITRAPNSNAYLTSITASNGTVITMTDHATKTYDINIPNSITDLTFVSAVPEVDTTTWAVTSTPSDSPLLTTAVNVFEITSTAEDGTTQIVYKINVTRDKSDNTNLSWLLLQEGIISPAFDPYTLKYVAKVPYDVTKGTLQIETESDAATYTVSSNINSLIVGENVISIRVTAEDGKYKDYEITIIRQTAEATSNKLFSLYVDPGTLVPAFDKDVPYYEVEVEYEVDSITVSGDPMDTSDAVVEGMGTYKLKVGRNVIGIRVYSSDNKERDYQILVRRKPSKDARLKALVLDGVILYPAFNPDIDFYNVSTQEQQLIFKQITTMHEDATYVIEDNFFPSMTGSYFVKIVVTAQDKVTQKTYTIQVAKEPSKNAYLSKLVVEGYTLTPTFNPATSVYQVSVPAETMDVNIIAVPQSPEATVDGTGIRTLSSGHTALTVTVTAGAGNQFTYTVIINKPASTDCRLQNLTLYNGVFISPAAFDPETFNYNVQMPYTTNYWKILNFSAKARDPYATTKINNVLGYGGPTAFIYVHRQVEVTAEAGNKCYYNLYISENHIVSPLLSELQFKDHLLDPYFNPNVTDYYLYQNNEETSVIIKKIKTLDPEATISYDASELSGMTEDDTIYDIHITVTASDGIQQKEYVIHVYHQAYIDNFLDYIYYFTPERGTEIYYPLPSFDKYTLTYTAELPNEVTKVDLQAAYKAGLTVTGLGIHDLATGTTTLPITVTNSSVKRTYLVEFTRAKSGDKKLKDLSLQYNGKEYVNSLVPIFDEDIKNYTLKVDVGTKSLDVSATIHEAASITGTGTIETPIGTTTITLVVTAENGESETYTITVTREASSDKTLIDLIPSDGDLDPTFNIDVDTYSLVLPSGVGTLSFEAKTADGTATITGIDSEIVPDGTSVRTIVVKAEDGTEKTYTVNVFKYSPNNAYLASLQVGSYTLTPTFDKDTTIYQVTVPNSMKSIGPGDVSAVPEDLSATVTKQSVTTLSTTEYTDYAILVTAADGATVRTYHLQVIRELGSTHTLASLSTTTGYIAETFSPTKYAYTYLIPTSQTVVDASYFKYKLTDEKSTIQFIPESIDLTSTELPTTMTIRVIAEDLSGYSDYVITLKWDFNSVNTLASLSVEYGYMVQTFKAGLYTYDVYEYVDATFDNVFATTVSDKATIKDGCTGTVNFEGKTDFYHYVTVVAEDGSELQYRIHFIVDRLRDENLEAFAIEGTSAYDCDDDECVLTPPFDPDVIEYDIAVPYDYVLLDWYYKLMNEQQRAVFKVNGVETTDRTYQLPVNETVDLTIDVYDGMNKLTKTYTIHILRHLSDNANLASLKITSTDGRITYPLDPAFSEDIYEYQIEVDKDVEEVLMSGATSDPNAKVKFNGYTYLIPGQDNLASATVTAPDGTVKVYYVHIIKSSEYNSWIKEIKISTGEFHELTPKFRKTTYNYTLTLSGEIDEVYVDAIPDVPTTIIRGTGTFAIGLGMTVIKLVGTAIDGSVSTYEIGIIQEASDDVDLKSLSMDGFELSPEFDPSVIHYLATIDETTTNVNVNAVAKDPKATIFITGDEGLLTGYNTITIQVLSQSRAYSKSYQIIAYRPVSSNSYLEDLNVYSVKDGEKTDYTITPTFVSTTYNYEVTVPYDVSGVYVGFTKAVPTSKVSGSGYQALDYGDKEVEITVTAEDNVTQKKYTITIHRCYNLYLEKIEMSGGVTLEPEFSQKQLTYNVTVPNSVKRVYIKGTPVDPENVTVMGNNTYPSATGVMSTTENTVASLVLTDPDGKTQTYTVTFIREKNTNTAATMITIAEGALSPKFDPTVQDYEVHVHKNVATIGHVNFTVTPKEATTTHTITGNSGLKAGENNVTVTMKAESGDEFEYRFKIYVEDDSYFSNQLLTLQVKYPGDETYNIALTPDFDPDTNSYTASVAYSVDNVDIIATSAATTAITGDTGNKALAYGNNLFNITVTNTADLTVAPNTYSLIVQRLEDNANLEKIVIDGHPLVFAQATTNYDININDDELSLNLVATPVDPNATVDIFGNGGFTTGNNTITIRVTTPTGKTKDYTINAKLAVSANPYLETLTIDGYTYIPEFDSTATQTYTLTVEPKINSILFAGKPVKPGTTCTNLGSVNLAYGENNISIICTASDKVTQHTYDFIVTREASSNTKLMSLTVTPGALNELFNEDIYNYHVKLDKNDGNIIRVMASAKDEESTVEGTGEYILTDKVTVIPVTVTAADGSKQVYNVEVTIYIDTTPTLSSMYVEEGQISPAFNKNVTTYSLHVPYEIEEVHVRYITTNDGSIVHITGDKGPDLHGPDGTGDPDGIPDGLEVKTNEVTVTVTSPDGSETNEYTIYVIRDPFASNKLSKITVKGNDGVYYDIDPTFDPDHLYYEVTVPYSVTKATVNGKMEDSSSTIAGNKQYTLNVGSNVAYLLVTSASNYTRTYTINITRQSEESTPTASYLKTLTEDYADADLTPAFDPSITAYSISVSSDTETITLGGTAAPGATVTGFGKSILKYGTTKRTITVKGTDGSETQYYVYITRPYTDKTAITSITPSVGILNYVDGVTEYDMDVEATVASISFDVVTADPLATVTGNEETTLAAGKNIITITIKGTNGEERNIRIFVNKSTAVTDIELDKHSIIVGVGESVSVGYDFTPSDTSYTDVTWSVDTPDYIDLAVNGLITGKSPGTSIVTITSDFDSNVKDTVAVKVIYKEITLKPNTYDKGSKTEGTETHKYIYKTEVGTKVNEYMKNFKNDKEYLHIYKSNGEEIDPESTDRLATGMYLELIVEDKVIDTAMVIVMGDTADGLITAVDLNTVKKGVKNATSIDDWYVNIALDMNYDGFFTAVDVNSIKLLIKKGS